MASLPVVLHLLCHNGRFTSLVHTNAIDRRVKKMIRKILIVLGFLTLCNVMSGIIDRPYKHPLDGDE